MTGNRATRALGGLIALLTLASMVMAATPGAFASKHPAPSALAPASVGPGVAPQLLSGRAKALGVPVGQPQFTVARAPKSPIHGSGSERGSACPPVTPGSPRRSAGPLR